MYGLIGEMIATPGNRDELAAILLSIGPMVGCTSYLIAKDIEDENVLWVTEVWENEAAHAASLELPGVRAAIAEGRPKIAGFAQRVVTEPLGGHGLGTNGTSRPEIRP